MAVPDEEMHAADISGLDHRLAVGDGQRHRLLDEDMLAMGRREADMGDMELVRGGDVERLDRVVGAEPLDTVIAACRRTLPREIAFELPARLLARVGGSDEPHEGMMRQGRQHQHESAAEADDAET